MATTKRSTGKGARTKELEDLRTLIRAVTAERDDRNARLAELEAQLKAALARAPLPKTGLLKVKIVRAPLPKTRLLKVKIVPAS